jgi:ribosomal protein S18 acetylase RimI-like enzyme
MEKITVGIIPIEGEVLYLKEGEREVGALQIIFTPNTLVLHSLEIQNRFRGRGYSKILLDNVLFRAKDKGYNYIDLQVNKDNNIAIQLYNSYGFKVIGLDDADNILYRLDVEPKEEENNFIPSY